MEIQFTALDPLFFRDGKPFSSGEETWADSNFPPNPSVLFGALRTGLATIPGREIAFSQVDNVLHDRALSVKQIYYLLKDSLYLPLPLDYVEDKMKAPALRDKEKESGQYSVHLMQLSPRKSILSTSKAPYLHYVPQAPFDRAEQPASGLIAAEALVKYLQDETPLVECRKMTDYVVEEPKVGNALEFTRTVEESRLYRTGMQRLLDLQIGMTVQNNAAYQSSELANTCVRLGGEGKIARIEPRTGIDLNTALSQIALKPGYFKIYLATPAIFDGNWPQLGIHAELIAACIGKPLSIGGYDMANKKPKPMYKAIPAGSVFYYKTNESPERVTAMLQGRSVSDHWKAQGYGIAYVGNFSLPNTPAIHASINQ